MEGFFFFNNIFGMNFFLKFFEDVNEIFDIFRKD